MMATTQLIVLVVVCVMAVSGDVTFSVSDCARNRETELLNFPRLSISPHPIKVPGDLRVSGDLVINRPVQGGLSLDVTIQRHFGFFWITLPCIGDVGSCTYTDACALLGGMQGTNHQCPQQLADSNIPCACPYAARSYQMADAVFAIPELTGIWSWLAEGDYKATAKLIDNQSGEEVACQHIELTVVDGHEMCSGFLCTIFG